RGKRQNPRQANGLDEGRNRGAAIPRKAAPATRNGAWRFPSWFRGRPGTSFRCLLSTASAPPLGGCRSAFHGRSWKVNRSNRVLFHGRRLRIDAGDVTILRGRTSGEARRKEIADHDVARR